jgi:Polyketide cyclase / dehydrase and lipid transport
VNKLSRAAAVSLGVILAASIVQGATLDSVIVRYDAGRYALDADAYLAAPREAIFVILTDYDRFGRISSVYKEYGFKDPAPDGTPIVFTRMEGCVLIFCRSLMRVELLEAKAPGFIRTITLPEQSDFKRSVSEWQLTPEGDGTRISYHLEVVPKFWVPPIVGPWILQRKLQSGGEKAVERIERLAQELSPAVAAR